MGIDVYEYLCFFDRENWQNILGSEDYEVPDYPDESEHYE
jgi:hypothetical protein